MGSLGRARGLPIRRLLTCVPKAWKWKASHLVLVMLAVGGFAVVVHTF